MIDLLEMQKYFILKHLREGDCAADFTIGNGHDTLFLSQTVGTEGHVWGFDIQPSALISTERRLIESSAPRNYTLICASHHLAANYIPCRIKAGMFNLGWFPGGDHSLTTKCQTTLSAVTSAVSMLDRDAVLLVAVYPGHDEGEAEGRMLSQYFSALDRHTHCSVCFRIVNSPASPYFFVIETK